MATTTTKYGHRVAYISIPQEDYKAIAEQAKRNCRTIGRELLYQWRKVNKTKRA